MNVSAYAKLNLTLDILRKREDGYHDSYTNPVTDHALITWLIMH